MCLPSGVVHKQFCRLVHVVPGHILVDLGITASERFFHGTASYCYIQNLQLGQM